MEREYTSDGVDVYYMDDAVIVAAYGLPNAEAQWDEGFYMFSDENVQKFKDFCDSEGFHYYARCKEDFFPFEAVNEAKSLGLNKVIVDNLS